MRPIYTAPTIEAAELALDQFDQAWRTRYPTVGGFLAHPLGPLAFFKYPVELRKIV